MLVKLGGGDLGVSESLVRRILHRMLHLYPYKMQSLLQIKPADISARELFAKWSLTKGEHELQWLFNVSWTNKAHFAMHGYVNTDNSRIWATSSPREYSTKPLHSLYLTV